MEKTTKRERDFEVDFVVSKMSDLSVEAKQYDWRSDAPLTKIRKVGSTPYVTSTFY